jgi:CheY-like chemotaxis protein
MMVTYRALIVEDSIDVRRALKAALELLVMNFQVADVPSAEEGILEFFRQPVDLLVTDFRLPGMTGFELIDRMRHKKPDMKVIMVTGMPEPEYRTQALAMGADAFFYKPLDIGEFVQTVKDIFQLANLPSSEAQAESEQQDWTISDYLALLRRESSAQAVLLLDGPGNCLAQAGEYLEYEPNAPFVPNLITLINAGRKLSRQLGKGSPEYMLNIAGEVVNFALIPVDDQYTVLIVLAGHLLDNPGQVFSAIRQNIEGLRSALDKISQAELVLPDGMPDLVLTKPPVPPAGEQKISEQDQELAELVTATGEGGLALDDVDAFWDNLEIEEDSPAVGNPDVLSYEEARRLGLAPGDEPD